MQFYRFPFIIVFFCSSSERKNKMDESKLNPSLLTTFVLQHMNKKMKPMIKKVNPFNESSLPHIDNRTLSKLTKTKKNI